MTTEAISAAMVPSRAAWRSLLSFAPLTALWILPVDRWPAIPASGIPTTTHQIAAHGLIALGLWLGLEHTSLTPGQRRATGLAIMIPEHSGSPSPGAPRSMASSIRAPRLYRCCHRRSSCL
jgi:hypothetical protein